jgi:branched-chain amino acid transport system substrate-binding protein
MPSSRAGIKIGEYASLTGKEAAFGQSSHKGTVLAIEEINAAGGVLGRQLELVSEDNQSKPGESATIATKLITREKVVALLGEVASSRSIEAAIVAQKYRIPLISPSSTNPKVTEIGNYIFRVCFIDPFQGTALAKFASSHLKARRVAIVTSVSSAYSVGLAKFFREQFVADGGQVVPSRSTRRATRTSRRSSPRSRPPRLTRSSCPATTPRRHSCANKPATSA